MSVFDPKRSNTLLRDSVVPYVHSGFTMLIIFGGLPGSRKSTIAQLLVQKRPAAYLRIDAVEHAILQSEDKNALTRWGILVAYKLATSNLALGVPVVADSVNLLEITSRAWREVATKMTSLFIEIEVVCSDLMGNERRVSSRKSNIPGFKLPTWDEVVRMIMSQGSRRV